MKTNSPYSIQTAKLVISALLIMLIFNVASGQSQIEKRAALENSLLKPMNIDFQGLSVWEVFEKLATKLKINIIFHQSVPPIRINLKLDNVSSVQTTNICMDRNNLDYIEMDERTIMIVKKSATAANSKGLEDFVIKANENLEADSPAISSQSPQFSSISVVFKGNSLLATIQQLAAAGHIAVEFDERFAEQFKQTKVPSFDLRRTTLPHAFKFLLDAYDLKYSAIYDRTIKIGVDIANPSSVPFEEIMAPRK
jgi:hypothetical protein